MAELNIMKMNTLLVVSSVTVWGVEIGVYWVFVGVVGLLWVLLENE